MTREDIIEATIAREGGCKVHSVPGDPGGTTKFGIAQRSHPGIDVASLNIEEAIEIYLDEYWHRINGDELLDHDPCIAQLVFDMAVNMGVKTASRTAQRCAGAKVDGMIGPKTLKAIANTDKELFVLRMCYFRVKLYLDIVRMRPEQIKFLHGWINRTIDVVGCGERFPEV